jgi:hypothetical protein
LFENQLSNRERQQPLEKRRKMERENWDRVSAAAAAAAVGILIMPYPREANAPQVTRAGLEN